MIQESDLNTSVTEIWGCGLGCTWLEGLETNWLGSRVHFKQVWAKGQGLGVSKFGVSRLKCQGWKCQGWSVKVWTLKVEFYGNLGLKACLTAHDTPSQLVLVL